MVVFTDRPTSLAALLALKQQHPDAKLVVGNTEVGIEMKFKAASYPVLIGTTHVPELNEARSPAQAAAATLSATVWSICVWDCCSRHDVHLHFAPSARCMCPLMA